MVDTVTRHTAIWLAVICCAAIWWYALPLAFAAEPFECRPIWHDADSAKCQDGRKIRIWGIDSPEIGQQNGLEAQKWVSGLFSGGTDPQLDFWPLKRVLGPKVSHADLPIMTCTALGHSFGRIVARCDWLGIDLGSFIVRHGWAWDYPAYSRGRYAGFQDMARADRLGIWAEPNPMPPWEWRKEHKR